MKIVHVFWGLTYGGIETMLVNMVNRQAEVGNEVSLLLINDMIEPSLRSRISRTVNVVCLNREPGSKSLRFIVNLNSKLSELNPDCVHLHASELVLLLRNRYKNMSTVTVHALPFGMTGSRFRLVNFIQWLLCEREANNIMGIKHVQRLVSISDAVANALRTKYRIESTVVDNGVCIDDFEHRKRVMFDGTMRIVSVGRLDHELKGQDVLIKAIARLRNKLNVTLDLIGDGRSREYLERLATESGAGPVVSFLGRKSQEYIRKSLCHYDLFVLPSREEGFGLVLVEALSAHLPVVSSAGHGGADLLSDGKYGYLFENGSSSSLARVLEHVHHNYYEALAKNERACLEMLSAYDVRVTSEKYIGLYRSQIC